MAQIQAGAIRQQKEIKSIQIWKEEATAIHGHDLI